MPLNARNYSPALMYGAEQTIKTSVTGDLLDLETTDSGAVGPTFDLYHNSSSPAVADVISRQQFYGNDDAGAKVEFARIDVVINDETAGTEDADINYYVMQAGTLALVFSVASGGVTSFVSPVTVTSTGAGATGSVLNLYHDSVSPAAADVVGRLAFQGEDDGSNVTEYARIDGVIRDVTGASEDGDMLFYVMRAGTETLSLTIDSDLNGIIVGDGAAAGIASSNGDFDFVLQTGNATTSNITITDGAAGAITCNMDGTGAFEVISTDAGAVGAVINLYQNSASPAVNDVMGRIQFQGEDDGGALTDYARIDGVITDATAGAEFATINFYVENGTGGEVLAGYFENDGSYGTLNVGNGGAAGVLSSNGDFDLIIETGNTTTSRITITDGAAGAITCDMDGAGPFQIVSTETGAIGAALNLYQNSASPAAADAIGGITFQGNDAGANKTDYVQIGGGIADPTEGTETGAFVVTLTAGGSFPTLFTFNLVAQGLTLTRTDDGAEGMSLVLNQVSASPAFGDAVGLIKFTGLDDGANTQEYAQINAIILDPTHGSEAGAMFLQVANASGVITTVLSAFHDGSNGIVSVGDSASPGILVSGGDENLILQTGNTTTGSITITDGANGDIAISPNGSGAVIIPAGSGIESATANVSVPFEYTAANEIIAEAAGGAISVATLVTTIGADAGGDTFTMAVGTIIGQKKKIIFVSTSGGTGVVTFAGRGTVNTLTFTAAGEYAEFIWDGTDWLDVELSSYGTFATPPVLSIV